MSTTKHDLAKLYQHSDDCQQRQIDIRLVGSVLQHLYNVTDNLGPTGSFEALELNQLKRLLSLANDACSRIVDVNQEYYLEDQAAAQKIEIEDPARPDIDPETHVILRGPAAGFTTDDAHEEMPF